MLLTAPSEPRPVHPPAMPHNQRADMQTTPSLDNTWPTRSKNAITSRLGRSASSTVVQEAAVAATASTAAAAAEVAATPAPDAKQAAVAPIAGSTGGGGRGPLSLPSRGVLFFGGVVRGGRASSGASVDLAAAGNDGSGVAGGKENGGRAGDLVYPALSRQSTPRGEPLCCKQLAQMPLSQVMVVRAGVVTLCAEGLLKLWARPSMPPPLPPLPVGGTRLTRKKVREETRKEGRHRRLDESHV